MDIQAVKDMITALSKDLGFTPEDLKDLCLTFSEEMSEEISKLRPALSACDYAALQNISHNIKGVSANMKMNALLDISKRMNDDLKAGRHEHLHDYIEALERLLPQMLEAIQSYYDSLR